MSALRFMLYIEDLIHQGQLELIEEVEGMEEMAQEEHEEEEDEDEEEDGEGGEEEEEGEGGEEEEEEEGEEGEEGEEEREGGEEGEERDQMQEQQQDNPPPLLNGWFERNEPFNLHNINEQQAWEQLRFRRRDILSIVEALRLPDLVPTNSGDSVTALEALCLVLYRFSSPSNLNRISHIFHRSPPAISRIINCTLKWIMVHWEKVLFWDTRRLCPARLEEYARLCRFATDGLCLCVFGFIDGTCRPICRPSIGQEGQYNGHKKHHTLNYQGIVATDGILIHLSRAFDGNCNDVEMFQETGMEELLNQHAHDNQDHPLAVYGDGAYQLSAHMLVQFDEYPDMPAYELEFNHIMNRQRASIEHAFAEITRNFGTLNYLPTQRLLCSPLEYHYRALALLTNLHTCLYGNQTTEHFHALPPTLREYLNDDIFTPDDHLFIEQ